MNLAAALSTDRKPTWIWIGLALLMLAVLATRVLPGWSYLVLEDGSLVLPENDPFYHFRHALYCLEHYPQLLRWDASSHFPAVQRSDAAGLYDLLLATLAWPLVAVGLAPAAALRWVCLLLPPLAMAGLIPLVFIRVRQAGGAGLGLVMALWALLLPGFGMPKTSLGFADHHLVEMVLGVVCIHLLIRLVLAERKTATARPWWQPAWVAALPLAAMQFSWLGASLWLPLLAVALIGQGVADVLHGGSMRPILRAAARYGLAFGIIVGTTGLVWPHGVLMPWLWQATLLGTVAALVALPAVGWWMETSRWRLNPATRLAAIAGGVAAGIAGVWWGWPSGQELLLKMVGRKSTLISENVAVTWLLYFQATGLAGILAWLAPLVGLFTAQGRRPGWWIGVLASSGFILLWMQTYDYGYQGSLHAVLLAGYVLAALWSARPAARQWLWAGSTALVALCVWPLRWTAPIWNPPAYYETGGLFATPAWQDAMTWMRDHTPVPSNPPTGRVGVLTDWPNGNLVNTLGQRPSTSAGYPEAEGLRPLLAFGEATARATSLRGSTVAKEVRYVALDAKGVAESFGASVQNAGLSQRNYVGQGSFRTANGQLITLPTLGRNYEATFAVQLMRHDGNGMAHFRLVYESRAVSLIHLRVNQTAQTFMAVAQPITDAEARQEIEARLTKTEAWKEGAEWRYQGQIIANVKLFEQVPGARLQGQADPGTLVTLSVPLRLRTSGRVWTYRQQVRANPEGKFEFTCPYSTEATFGQDIEATGPARLSGDFGSTPVNIPETAVQAADIILVFEQ